MTTPPPGSREAAALADRLEAHTEQMANTSWGLTMQEWNVISNDILLAARTLRAALAPPADGAGEVEAIRERHAYIEAICPNLSDRTHADRATLLRALDAMAEENARMKEALQAIVDNAEIGEREADTAFARAALSETGAA